MSVAVSYPRLSVHPSALSVPGTSPFVLSHVALHGGDAGKPLDATKDWDLTLLM